MSLQNILVWIGLALVATLPLTARAACDTAGDNATTAAEQCDETSPSSGSFIYASGYASCTDTSVGFLDGTISCDPTTCTVIVTACDNDIDGDGVNSTLVPGGTDCVDDTSVSDSASYYPGATEIWYDGKDYNCDGRDDFDQDADGYRAPGYSVYETYQGATLVVAVGAVTSDDCVDDTSVSDSASYYPGATEIWYDGKDYNCDGRDDWDADGDEHAATAAAATAAGESYSTYDDTLQGTVTVVTGEFPVDDCNDTDATFNPGATDTWYDGLDSDCAGNDDWDADDDGYASTAEAAAAISAAYVTYGTTYVHATLTDPEWEVSGTGEFPVDDCVDDTSESDSASYYLGAPDAWYDGKDYDCQANDDYDQDGDGSRDENKTAAATKQGSVVVVSEEAFLNDDCNDSNDTIFPDADEVCDDIDNNCDELVDDDDPDVTFDPSGTVYYVDSDNDGYGDDDTAFQACDAPSDAVTIGGDCDDDDAPTIYPGADELCDGIDNDCDLLVDDDDTLSPTAATAWYTDRDSDGYPDGTASPTYACTQPVGYLEVTTTTPSDCNDFDDTINPGADEACDGVDNNCNGLIDDDDVDNIDAATTTAFYPDADADSYPDLTATAINQCTAPAGYLTGEGATTDCNDANAAVNPGETEVCDGVDNDCDDLIDEDDPSLSSTYTYYTDADNDGYGDPDDPQASCESSPLAGYADNADDCDDSTSDVRPGAIEVCDGRRNNCTTGSGIPSDEIDVDGDGYVECGYDGTLTWQGPTTVEVGEDCGPSDPNTYPYATETCDGIYNNCESSDYSATTAPADETDDDGDGYVECFDGTTTWQSSFFTPSTGMDCDDDDSTVHPSATEICDGQFNDCDDTDYGAQDAPSDELDDDGDGYVECRDGSVTWVGDSDILVGADCDDDDASVSPGATETGVCDGVDTDCDGSVSWANEQDADGDGYVVCNYAAATWKGSTEVLGGLDCDDAEALVYPDAAEICDGRFNDCNDTFYGVQDAPDDELDDDGDYFVECWDGSTAWAGDVTIVEGEDCDDTDPFTFPGASPNEADPDACTTDADDDGWGDASAAEPIEAGTDCDDAAADTYPGATEVCEEGTARDNDCDGNPNTEAGAALPGTAGGAIEVYWDADGDGWGGETEAVTYVCDRDNLEGVYAYTNSDCDDSNPTVYPGAPEICNGFDDNCNDQVDRVAELDPDVSGCVTMYRDLDEDGYGDIDNEACVCSDDSDSTGAYDGDDRYVIYDLDCDDTDENTHPLSCSDGIDNDPEAADGTDEEDPDCQAGLDENGVEVEKAYEFVDGNDNDCDGRVAAIELDCDDDGSFALLPFQRSAILDNVEAGLSSCGEDGATRSISCWETPAVQLECDGASGLWMFRYSDASTDLTAERFDGGRRTWTGSRPCATSGDCDDQCASRCPDLTEACDGIDNDCSAADLSVQDSADLAGIPDSMLSARDVAGTVPAVEQDIDQDGYLACDDFSASAPQVLSSGASCDDIVSDEALLTDCERRCSLSFPGAEERCNGFLDDCNGEVEGSDVDFDGYRTCGAWSAGGQDEMPEDIVMVVWVAPETDSTADLDEDGTTTTTTTTTTSDTSTTNTGGDSTTLVWDGDHAYVPLILPRALSLSAQRSDHTEVWQQRERDGDVLFECDSDNTADGNTRRVLYTCDEELYYALSDLVGDLVVQEAICTSDATPLLAPCDSGTGGCGIVALTLDANVDSDLWSTHVPAYSVDPACEDRPEELISRGVWPAARILSARTATVAYECNRLYGLDCDDITATSPLVGTWDSLADPSNALAADSSWWKEVDRFSTEPIVGGTVGWCWGDPSDGLGAIGQRTGGDCTDSAGKSHRDSPEGPGDLMGLLDPDGAADCSTCVDGIDNNCDGQIDCADPSCAACFVGQGVGCGGGDEAQCAGAGCTTLPSPVPSGLQRFALVVLLSLAGAAVGRRKAA